MKYLNLLLFVAITYNSTAQISDEIIGQYINGNGTPVQGWLLDAKNFYYDSTENHNFSSSKKFYRFLRKQEGRLNFTGSNSNSTVEDLSTYIDNLNPAFTNYCPTGGNGWINLGPASTPSSHQRAGLFTCVVVHPNNQNLVYAGTEMSGMWKGIRSTATGQFNWSRIDVSNAYSALGVTAIHLVPGPNPGIDDELIIGTMRHFIANEGHGIFRSVDAGQSWSKSTMKTAFPTSGGTIIENARIRVIKRSPNNSNILFACGLDRVFYSVDGGLNWGQIIDEVVSGWNTFTFNDIEFCQEPLIDVVYITGNNNNGINSSPAKIYKISNFNINSWGTLTDMSFPNMSLLDRPEKLLPIPVAVSTADPEYFYVMHHTQVNSMVYNRTIYRIHHSASSWPTPLSSSPTCKSIGIGSSCLESYGPMDNSPTFVLSDRPVATAGAPITHMYAGGLEMAKTTDGGLTWINVSDGSNLSSAPDYDTHVDIRDLQLIGFDATSQEDFVAMANDGGLSISLLSGLSNTWENINDYSLNSLDTERPGVSFINGRVITGAWHNGLHYSNLNGGWSMLGGGDYSDFIIDNRSDNSNRGFLSYWNGVNLFDNCSEDHPTGNGPIAGLGGAISSWLEIEPIFRPFLYQNPINHNELYIGTKKLHLVDLTQSTPKYTSTVLFNQNTIPANKREEISTIGISSDGMTIYLALKGNHTGTDDILFNHKFFKIDLNQSPVSIVNLTPNLNNQNNAFPNSDAHISWLNFHFITDIIVDPSDPNIVFASLSDYSSPSLPCRVIYSIDGGINWVDFSGSLPLVPMSKLLMRGESELYVASDVGVYTTTYQKNFDAQGNIISINASNWQCLNLDLPMAVVNNMVLNTCNDELTISTWGNGIWRTTLDPLNTGDLIISGQETWSIQKEVYQNIIIPAGAELKITGELFMHGRESLIHVMPGGKLEVDGGIITSNCKDWLGIYVEGNAGLAQYASNQGEVRIINGGTISNARDAITNINPNWDMNKTGGIIYANNANFINNRRDVQLLKFYNSGGPYYGSYMAEFYNTTFERNDDYRLNEMISDITMWSVEGVQIKNCVFQNLNSGDFKWVGSALFTNNASFVLDELPNQPGTGNTFQGYFDAIKVVNTNGINVLKNIVINKSQINDCFHGMYLSGTQFSKITNNSISSPISNTGSEYTPPFGVQTAKYGIYLDQSTNYDLSNNTIISAAYNPSELTVGIVIKNSGPASNQAYGNTVDGFTVGIEAIGHNSDLNDLATGLQFLCNQMGDLNQTNAIGNQTDFFVTNDLGVNSQNTGVAAIQGRNNNSILSIPTGNTFTQGSASNHFDNRIGSVVYNYNSSGSSNEIPTFYTGIIPVATDPLIPIDCSQEGFPRYTNINEYQTAINALEGSVNSSQGLRSSLSNGGPNSTIEAQILFASNQQEYQEIYVDLMDISPYVEANTLIDVINLPNYPELALRNILIANPHAGREEDVQLALSNRVPALSQSTLNDIDAGTQTISSYDVINMRIDSAQRLLEGCVFNLSELIANDTIVGVDSLVSMLKSRKQTYYRYALIDHYISLEDSSSAKLELSKVPTECPLTEQQQIEYQEMKKYYTAVFDNWNSFLNNDSIYSTELNDLVALNSGFLSTMKALNLLRNSNGLNYVEPIYNPNSISKTNELKNYNRPESIASKVLVSPNPSTGLISVIWDADQLFPENVMQIEIVDINGGKIITKKAEQGKSWLTIDLSKLANGSYICVLHLSSGKLIREKLTLINN